MPTDSEADLRRKAEGGDAEAALALGRRLLIGQDAPFKPQEGMQWVGRAAEAGDAEAMVLAATLAAAGVGRPRDWDVALNGLRAAADAGHQSAAAQLEVITSAFPTVAAWLAPPARTPVCDAPRVRTIAGFLPPGVCRWLMDRAAPHLAPATRFNPETGRSEPHPGRTNDIFVIDVLRSDVVGALVRARISAALDMPTACFEPTQMLRYRPGQEFAPHFDFVAPGDFTAYDTGKAYEGQRIVTFLVYLNDDFEGGETAFPRADLKVRGKTGEAVFFANVGLDQKPDKSSLHAGLPPTRGEKWVLSQWIHDRPFTAV